MARSDEEKAEIVREAQERWKRVDTWESDSRVLFQDDVRFANGDADNGWQWPDSMRKYREDQKKPCLTINKTRQHNLQVINDAKKNKSGIKIRPVGDGATFQTAQILNGVVRHVEDISNAIAAYDHATKYQVQGGIGFWRVTTDYTAPDSFDQEIYIKRIIDPLTVYLDPDIKESDGSDAKFAIIGSRMKKDEFDLRYPKYKSAGSDTLGLGMRQWLDQDHIMIAEYYRVIEERDELLALKNGKTALKSAVPAAILRQVEAEDGIVRRREIFNPKIEWFKIAGNDIVEETIWLGKYIPVVRVIGEEVIIDGRLDRKGHTRALKDPQRMYNYHASASVEFTALQTKTPYLAAVQAIEGYQQQWAAANLENAAYLPWNHLDENGNPIPKPERIEAPQVAPAYIQGMREAKEELMMASGQYQENFGQPSNAISGRAIQERQRQGDTATYHFIDNQAKAIRFTGKIIVDLVPKVYDTARIKRILAEDGSETHVEINPSQSQALTQQEDPLTGEIKHIFNPGVGDYEVYCDVGPNYATQREEAFSALSQIAQQDPEFMKVAGDILWKAADFPMADELAARWQKILPPEITGAGPTQQQQQSLATIQQLQGVIKQLLEENSKTQLQNEDKSEKSKIETYRAETDRFKVLADHGINVQELGVLIAQTLHEMQMNKISTAVDAHVALNPPQTDSSPQGEEGAAAA